MEINKEYKQIYINPRDGYYKTDIDVLKGKVVDKVALSDDRQYEDQCELIITFKDKTYVAFDIYDIYNGEERDQVYNIGNSANIHPQCYNSGELPHWIDSSGNLRFKPLVKNRIDCGLWIVTEEEVAELIKRNKEKCEEYEWQQYLRLKEKFKNRIEKQIIPDKI